MNKTELDKYKKILETKRDELARGSRIVAMSFCEPRSCIGRLSS